MTYEEMIHEIVRMKREKNAVVLAHYYQTPDIQDVADFVGDSLQLSQQAAETSADVIVFCGVHFMAETAKILSPSKKVLLPDLEAGCSLEQSCPPREFGRFISKVREEHPRKKVQVVSYINCSAEVKTMSDVICTSSNADRIVSSIPKDDVIIFAPDKNLGRYIMNKTGRDMILWDGACLVHQSFAIDKLLALWGKHPGAKLVAHPESEEHILRVAHFVGSTTGMINFVKNDPCGKFLIATEAGVLHQMSKVAPEKVLVAVPSHEDNTCACSECPFMKLNTVEKLYDCMLNERPEIKLDLNTIFNAYKPIRKMLDLS